MGVRQETLKNIREINEIRVLRTVRDEGPISRAALARKLRLSKAAMSGITHRLVERGLVSEVGKGSSTRRGGRKEVLLALNPRAGIVPVIEIDRVYAKVALLDLNAALVAQDVLSYASNTDPETVTREAIARIRALCRKENVGPEALIGVGVGVPGIIDYERGIVREARTLSHWCDYPLRTVLEVEFGVPVFIENDVKTLTLGEFQYGSGRTVEDLVSLWIGDGIGAGIVINGKLLRGASSSAGEIEFNSFARFNGEHDNIALVVGDEVRDWGDVLRHQKLLESVSRARRNGHQTKLPDDCSVSDVIRMAEEGDDLAGNLLWQFGWVLGTLCSNLIHTLNPPMLILNGVLFDKTDVVINAVKERISQDILRTPLEVAAIEKGTLKENAVIIGAGALVLDDFFLVPDHWVKSRSRAALQQAHPSAA